MGISWLYHLSRPNAWRTSSATTFNKHVMASIKKNTLVPFIDRSIVDSLCTMANAHSSTSILYSMYFGTSILYSRASHNARVVGLWVLVDFNIHIFPPKNVKPTLTM